MALCARFALGHRTLRAAAVAHSSSSPLHATALRRVHAHLAALHPAASTSSGSMTVAEPSGAGSLEIVQVKALQDNYVWVVRDKTSGLTAVVDPSEAAPVQQALQARGWKLDQIWNTHHHNDHIGGNDELRRAFPGLTIVAAGADKDRIPNIDKEVGDGDSFTFGGTEVHVLSTPGHTRAHITYWAPSANAVFPGDTLFALGCGRLFEGNPEQMWTSLSKILPLPDHTHVYCAHEYTQSNARFAVTVDPGNELLAARKADIDKAREQGLSTVPSLLGDEKATNPFLRPFDAAIRAKLGFAADAEDWKVFGAVRAAKDSFRG